MLAELILEEPTLVRSSVMPMTAITCSCGECSSDSAATQRSSPSNMATHHRWYKSDFLKRHELFFLSMNPKLLNTWFCNVPMQRFSGFMFHCRVVSVEVCWCAGSWLLAGWKKKKGREKRDARPRDLRYGLRRGTFKINASSTFHVFAKILKNTSQLNHNSICRKQRLFTIVSNK